VHCTIGAYDALRRDALRAGAAVRAERSIEEEATAVAEASRAAGGELGGFVLRRLGGDQQEPDLAPPIIELGPSRPRVVVGRDGGACHVVIRRDHLSKAHATLEPKTKPDGKGWALTIRDTSANGTWVNKQRLRAKELVPLDPGNIVSFLQNSHALYKDSLTYQVCATLASSSSSAAAARSATVALHTFGRLHAPAVPASGERPQVAALAAAGVATTVAAASSRVGAAVEPPAKRARPGGGGAPAWSPPVAAALPLRALPVNVPPTSREARRHGDVQIAAAVEQVDIVDDIEEDAEVQKSMYTEDVGAWLRSLDGGSLVQYEAALDSMYDCVSQIKTLYRHRIADFFCDTGVEDPDHRLAFATAIKRLG